MSSKGSKISKKGSDLEEFMLDQESNYSVNYGVTPDRLDTKRLFGLIFIGILIVSVMIGGVQILFNYYSYIKSQAAAENAVFFELEDIRARDKELLTTFGVVDGENGVYRAPVDSAITLVLEDYSL